MGEVGCSELMIDAQQESVNEGGLVGQDIRSDKDSGDSISTVASFVEISHGQGRECRLLVISAKTGDDGCASCAYASFLVEGSKIPCLSQGLQYSAAASCCRPDTSIEIPLRQRTSRRERDRFQTRWQVVHRKQDS